MPSHRSWRGHVTRVPGGERVYAREPSDVPTLLACQIDKSGIRLGWYWRLQIILLGWRRPWRRQK